MSKCFLGMLILWAIEIANVYRFPLFEEKKLYFCIGIKLQIVISNLIYHELLTVKLN